MPSPRLRPTSARMPSATSSSRLAAWVTVPPVTRSGSPPARAAISDPGCRAAASFPSRSTVRFPTPLAPSTRGSRIHTAAHSAPRRCGRSPPRTRGRRGSAARPTRCHRRCPVPIVTRSMSSTPRRLRPVLPPRRGIGVVVGDAGQAQGAPTRRPIGRSRYDRFGGSAPRRRVHHAGGADPDGAHLVRGELLADGDGRIHGRGGVRRGRQRLGRSRTRPSSPTRYRGDLRAADVESDRLRHAPPLAASTEGRRRCHPPRRAARPA